MVSDKNLESINKLHRTIERAAEGIYVKNASRLHCKKGCHDCCVDDVSVFEIEAHNIRHFNEALLKTGIPHPKGSCAFLDNKGSCRIYKQRPYVCLTQGLPLHWLEEGEDGVWTAMRDICPLNGPGEPIENLPKDSCWEIGPFEERLARLQLAIDSGEMRRVKLRDLFTPKESLNAPLGP